MKKITRSELNEILEKHQKYLNGEEGGECADFSNTDLSFIDFSYVNLSHANLSHANLEYANLPHANLFEAFFTRANLSHANFSDAYLYNADLVDANLTCAILKYANLNRANFAYANLQGTNLSYATLAYTILDFANLNNAKLLNSYLSNTEVFSTNFANAVFCDTKLDNVNYSHTTAFFNLACPEEGSFIGFKKVRCSGGNICIAKLFIFDDSKRSSATTRKCRASKVKVLGFYDFDKNELPLERACSIRDDSFIYHKGEIIEIYDFDENRWNECSTGIHFFLTFDEAKNYKF